MIFIIKQDKKLYAAVEYTDDKTFKIINATDMDRKELQSRLDEEFSVYDPRDGKSHSKPKDTMLAYLFLEQAIFQTKANTIEFEGNLWNGELPDDRPGIVY